MDLKKEDLARLKSILTYHMYLYDGIGLSAVQLGILRNAFVIHDFISDDEKFFVNPKIISKSNKYCAFNEGCLSFPNKIYRLQRPSEITIQYFDLNGEHVENFDGLNARIIQHEYDHLQGITFDKKIKKYER